MTSSATPSIVIVDDDLDAFQALASGLRLLGFQVQTARHGQDAAQVARSRATVLITGETGTGKELVAQALHLQSGRTGPFVALNCAALSEALLESELFGHERGAFTGSLGRREGRFKQADGGTLFLDEISEIPTAVQVQLLRFLQERSFERVGRNVTETVDVRIVAATNRDLGEWVSLRRFREDLYFRLNVVDISVPPLGARRSDVPALFDTFLHRICVNNAHTLIPTISPDAMQCLMSYGFPGNGRELQNAAERVAVLCDGDEVLERHLPSTIRNNVTRTTTALDLSSYTLAELERKAIAQVLESLNGSPQRAAQQLGFSLRPVQYRIKEWGLRGVPTECPS